MVHAMLTWVGVEDSNRWDGTELYRPGAEYKNSEHNVDARLATGNCYAVRQYLGYVPSGVPHGVNSKLGACYVHTMYGASVGSGNQHTKYTKYATYHICKIYTIPMLLTEIILLALSICPF